MQQDELALRNTLADELRHRNTRVDIAFIDGCHDFEYALFDAIAMGTLMSRNGIMILDICEQPGVISACLESLRLNPDWRKLGSATKSFNFCKPFRKSVA